MTTLVEMGIKAATISEVTMTKQKIIVHQITNMPAILKLLKQETLPDRIHAEAVALVPALVRGEVA